MRAHNKRLFYGVVLSLISGVYPRQFLGYLGT
jgi:hypothetical protein